MRAHLRRVLHLVRLAGPPPPQESLALVGRPPPSALAQQSLACPSMRGLAEHGGGEEAVGLSHLCLHRWYGVPDEPVAGALVPHGADLRPPVLRRGIVVAEVVLRGRGGTGQSPTLKTNQNLTSPTWRPSWAASNRGEPRYQFD